MLRHFARPSLPAAQRTAVRSCVRPLRTLPAPAPSGALNPFDRSSTEVRRDRPPAHRRRQRAALRAGGRRARRPHGLAHARGAPRSARRRRACGRGRRRRAARAERRAPPRGARRACARRHAVVLACSARGPSVDASPHTRSRPCARTRRSPTHARAPASGSPCCARRRAASGRLAHCSSGKRARRSREWRCGSCRMHGRASGRATRPAIATIAAIARVADAA